MAGETGDVGEVGEIIEAEESDMQGKQEKLTKLTSSVRLRKLGSWRSWRSWRGCGRGSDRPVASTGNGVVTFRDANWICACAYDATHSLTGMYAKDIYYRVGLNLECFLIKSGFS